MVYMTHPYTLQAGKASHIICFKLLVAVLDLLWIMFLVTLLVIVAHEPILTKGRRGRRKRREEGKEESEKWTRAKAKVRDVLAYVRQRLVEFVFVFARRKFNSPSQMRPHESVKIASLCPSQWLARHILSHHKSTFFSLLLFSPSSLLFAFFSVSPFSLPPIVTSTLVKLKRMHHVFYSLCTCLMFISHLNLFKSIYSPCKIALVNRLRLYIETRFPLSFSSSQRC